MRLCYISLQSFDQGTAGYTHVHEIVSGLQELGVDVQLHTPKYRRPTRSVLIRAWVMLGMQARFLTRWFLGSKPDVLYIRHHYAALPITLLARVLSIPIVVEVNGPVEDFIVSWSIPRWLAPIVKQCAYWQCRLGSWVIGVTPGIVRSLSSEYGVPAGRVTLVPNGVNTDLFKPIAAPDLGSWPQLQGKKFVTFVGALSPWQGLETMLAAVESPHWPESVALVIAGAGVLRREVEQFGSSRLIYLGTIPYEMVPCLVNASIGGLCLKSTLHEESGLSPLKLYEYAACGRPVIVNDLPGLNNFVLDSGCGLIIPCNDPIALCQAVQKLLGDPQLAEMMGSAGAAYVREGYSWHERARMTFEILQNVGK